MDGFCEWIFGIFIGALFAGLISHGITSCEVRRSWEEKAVALGHARYVMQPNGSVKFEWITPTPTTQPDRGEP